MPLPAERCLFATMHGKDVAVAPLAARFLNLDVVVCEGIDTDRFGTFTGEIARSTGPLEAARAKAAAARAAYPGALWVLASEGSFGPHPHLGFVPMARELVLLANNRSGQELVGHDATFWTNFAHARVEHWCEVEAFARRCGFPEHGIIVSRLSAEPGSPRVPICKDARDWPALRACVSQLLADDGAGFVETDMRAHRNPIRRRAIRRAFANLIRASRSLCPACRHPGFVVTRREAGLPCRACRTPTLALAASIKSCRACDETESIPTGQSSADPGLCPRCNP